MNGVGIEVKSMKVGEIRYYKGLVPVVVEVVSKGNVGVRFLEDFNHWKHGEKIVTCPRLLWTKPKKRRAERETELQSSGKWYQKVQG